MTHLRAPILLLLASIAAAMSCGYAAAQDADKNPWMAEVAKAAADGRCDEAKTIALRNGSLDVAERVLKLCTPSKAAAPVVQLLQAAPKPVPVAEAPQAPVGNPGVTSLGPSPLQPVVRVEPTAASTGQLIGLSQINQGPTWRRKPTAIEFSKYYPKKARKLGAAGDATIDCKITENGTLQECVTVFENPLDMGFGDAAIKLSSFFEIAPSVVSGTNKSNGYVQIPVKFSLRNSLSVTGYIPPAPTSINYENGTKYYNHLAFLGDDRAQSILGIMYRDGEGLVQNYSTAREWFRKSADNGNKKALALIGQMYASGLGVQQDYVVALDYYRKSADQGDALGQALVGLAYYTGQGVAPNYAMAVAWYRKGADQGPGNTLPIQLIKNLCADHPTITGCPYP